MNVWKGNLVRPTEKWPHVSYLFAEVAMQLCYKPGEFCTGDQHYVNGFNSFMVRSQFILGGWIGKYP